MFLLRFAYNVKDEILAKDQRRKFRLFFPPQVEKDELYSYVHIAYNLVQKEKSNGNIKQTMYPDSEIIVEK